MTKRFRLIFVDDEPWALIGLRNIIDWEARGFEVVALCESGEEAVEVLRANSIDAVCTDIRMPTMSGFDLVSLIHKERLAKAFIILSAYREFAYAHQALVEGALYYLIKPLDVAEVEKAADLLYQHLAKGDAGSAPEEPQVIDLDRGLDERTMHWLQTAAVYAHCYVWLGDALFEGLDMGRYEARSVLLAGVGTVYLLTCERPLSPDTLPEGIYTAGASGDFQAFPKMVAAALRAKRCGFRYVSNSVVAHVQGYLGEHYAEHIVIRDVARRFYLSEVYLSELFKKHTGRTIIHFVKDIRLHLASDMLRSTSLSIKEIAREVGYDDPSYFGRLFKKEKLISPEAYRKEQGGEL